MASPAHMGLSISSHARAAALALVCAGLTACASLLVPPVPPAPPAPPKVTTSAEAANALTAASAERAATEARYTAAETICYQRFFVTNCLDAAKEKRRSALAQLRAIEVDAKHFQRQAQADETDRKIAAAEKAAADEEARLAAEPPPPVKEITPIPPPRANTSANRVAEQAAKQARLAAQDKADAGKRAANVAAFEKNKQEAAQRQADVAAKKVQRAKEKAERDAKAAQDEKAAKDAQAAKDAAAKAAANK
jgi:colicin import membrane protein